MRILAFGEILWDVIEGEHCIGGAPFNFCGHLARMGADSTLISAVGTDSLGEKALEHLSGIGVSDRNVYRLEAPTGIVPVVLEEGIPSYEIREGSAWDQITLSDEQIDELASQEWDLFYIGSLAQRTESNRELLGRLKEKLRFRHCFYDVNLRQDYYSREILEESFRTSTIAKLNDEEVDVISKLFTGDVMAPADWASWLRKSFSVEMVCVTLGKKGAAFYHDKGSIHLSPSPVTVVDTVGAGDSFSAGLVYGWLSTDDLKCAGQLALNTADYVVSHAGALPEYDSAFLKQLQQLGSRPCE